MSITNIFGHMQQVVVILKNTQRLNGVHRDRTPTVQNPPSGLELKAQCMYLFLLSNPMCSSLCLQIILWIPVRIKYNYSVSRCQVDT